MNTKLERNFFNRKTVQVAKALLGKYLIFNNCIGLINETEAYTQNNDKACHAYKGKTKRNEVMFGPAGFSYVYFVYGMYYCLNFVTEEKAKGCAVLIRSVVPISGINQMQENRIKWWKNKKIEIPKNKIKDLTNGPSKLCISFGISKNQNNIDICKSNNFYIEDRGFEIKKSDILITPRIGIKESTNLLYRFVLK
jgi:DNA-3-methyladenine glycosylase